MDEPKRLYRPRTGRMLSGVCAGLANYFGMDPTLVRVIYAILSVCTAIITGAIIYVILLLIHLRHPVAYHPRRT